MKVSLQYTQSTQFEDMMLSILFVDNNDNIDVVHSTLNIDATLKMPIIVNIEKKLKTAKIDNPLE